MYEGLQAGDRVRITHPTGITEEATVDSVIRRDFPALYVTYTDRTTGRVAGTARVEKVDN